VARGGEYYISKPRWSSGKINAPGGPSTGQKGSILFLDYFFILGDVAKLRWAGGGAQRPVWRVNESKGTGARSARARTRGQNPLVQYKCLVPIYVFPEIKLCSLLIFLISKTEL
jgi:hypothetical protein